MIFIIGGNGFVGSAYSRLFSRKGIDHRIITRENAESYRGQSCDVLINANGNSQKFLADRDPLWEFDASVTSVARSLEWFQAERYVLLSTGDVYPETHSPSVTREDQILEPSRQSRYGLHKSLAETLVRGAHPRHLIVRMGGFVGPGLRKNAIYDMINSQPLWLDPDSELQFVHTDTAANIVHRLVATGVENDTVNLGATGTVKLREIYDRVASMSILMEGARRILYQLNLTHLQDLYGGTLPNSKEEVWRFLDSLKDARGA